MPIGQESKSQVGALLIGWREARDVFVIARRLDDLSERDNHKGADHHRYGGVQTRAGMQERRSAFPRVIARNAGILRGQIDQYCEGDHDHGPGRQHALGIGIRTEIAKT